MWIPKPELVMKDNIQGLHLNSPGVKIDFKSRLLKSILNLFESTLEGLLQMSTVHDSRA